MAVPLPLLALLVLLIVPAPAVGASQPLPDLRDAVAQTTAVLPQAQQVVRSQVETVEHVVRETASDLPVATVVEQVREPVANVQAAVRQAVPPASVVRAPAASPTPSVGGDASPGTREVAGGAIGRPDNASHRFDPAALPPTARGHSAGSLLALTDGVAPRPGGDASSTSASGGQDDDPIPGGPPATTGGISGPLGFVLIAAMLAFVFWLAPRIISMPLRMSPARGHQIALALPLERPD